MDTLAVIRHWWHLWVWYCIYIYIISIYIYVCVCVHNISYLSYISVISWFDHTKTLQGTPAAEIPVSWFLRPRHITHHNTIHTANESLGAWWIRNHIAGWMGQWFTWRVSVPDKVLKKAFLLLPQALKWHRPQIFMRPRSTIRDLAQRMYVCILYIYIHTHVYIYIYTYTPKELYYIQKIWY